MSVEYAIYSSYRQRWFGAGFQWVEHAAEAKGFPSLKEATNFIQDVGLINTTDAAFRNGAYVCPLT